MAAAGLAAAVMVACAIAVLWSVLLDGRDPRSPLVRFMLLTCVLTGRPPAITFRLTPASPWPADLAGYGAAGALGLPVSTVLPAMGRAGPRGCLRFLSNFGDGQIVGCWASLNAATAAALEQFVTAPGAEYNDGRPFPGSQAGSFSPAAGSVTEKQGTQAIAVLPAFPAFFGCQRARPLRHPGVCACGHGRD